jgi:rhamnogalacturonyl hydrolase YesR
MVPRSQHVDAAVFGIVPLEIARQTGDSRCLSLGQTMADQQWELPPGKELSARTQAWKDLGLSWHTRFWIDDMYMISALQAQAFRATGDTIYRDRAAREMCAYLDALQKPNGLFYHAPDVPFYWGRGNGWVAAGMTELLRELPEDHPHRARILAGYKLMMAALLKHQDSEGMWHQLVDHVDSWPETSCTAMFTYAMITGVKRGWLEGRTYGSAARAAWIGLTGYLEPNGDLREVCEGTNKRNSLQHYQERHRRAGDLHGQAPMLWCASAWLRD